MRLILLACAVAVSSCSYLEEMEAEAAAESAVQAEAVNSLYARLGKFRTALTNVEPSACALDDLESASKGQPPLLLDAPLVEYAFASDVMDEHEYMLSLGWWDFIRSPVFVKLRPRAHQNSFIFDAVAAENAMQAQGVTAVTLHDEVVQPKMGEGDSFISGEYRGVVVLLDNTSAKVLCARRFTAASSDSLFAVGGALGVVSGGTEGALEQDFQSNILKGAKHAVSALWAGPPAVSKADTRGEKRRRGRRQRQRQRERRALPEREK